MLTRGCRLALAWDERVGGGVSAAGVRGGLAGEGGRCGPGAACAECTAGELEVHERASGHFGAAELVEAEPGPDTGWVCFAATALGAPLAKKNLAEAAGSGVAPNTGVKLAGGLGLGLPRP